MRKINKFEFILVLTFIRKLLELKFATTGMYIIIEFATYIILFAIIFLEMKTNKSKIPKNQLIILIFLILAQTVGFLYSYLIENTFNKYIYRIIEFIMTFYLLYICAGQTRITEKKFNNVMMIIIITALISSLYAMIFQLNSSVFTVSATNNFRMDNIYQSFWGHRNQFAVVLIGAIMATFYFIINKIKVKSMIILFLIFMINLIFTYSRTSYGALIVFFAWYFIFSKKNIKVQISTWLILLITILIGMNIYQNNLRLREFIDDFIIRKEAGLTGRDTLWNEALEYIDLPTIFFGRSYGIARLLLQDDSVGNSTGFHNMYLTHLITGGVVMIYFLIRTLMSVMKKMNYNKIEKNMKNYFISCIIAFLFYGMFEVTDFFKIGLQQILQTYYCITLPLLYFNIRKENEKI